MRGGVGCGQGGLQPVAEGHEGVDFGHDAVLFCERWQGERASPQLCHIYGRQICGLFRSILEKRPPKFTVYIRDHPFGKDVI